MFAKELTAQLDCSYQLVGKRGRYLAELDLVKRDENEKGRSIFKITPMAQEIYFVESPEDEMDFSNPDH